MDLVVRSMETFDIDDVFEIEKECFITPWSKESFRNEIENNNLAYYIVAVFQNSIAGYMGIWTIIDEGHITNVAVGKNYRKKGIGKFLVSSMIAACEEKGVTSFTLEVRKSNYEAISLYEKMGFSISGVRSNYYKDTHEDALIMWRSK